jgi:hypothetical protein
VWLVASHEGRSGGPPASAANYRRFTSLTDELGRLYPRSHTVSFAALRVVTVTLYSH